MHVLFLSYPGGGLETNVRVLAPELRGAGHRVTILSPEAGPSPSTGNQETSGTCFYRRGNLHYYFHRVTFGLGSLSRVARSLEESRAIGRRVRSIHERDPIDLIEVPEIFASSRLFQGIPFVVRLHGSAWTFRVQLKEPSGIADDLERRMEARTLKSASGISSPSRAIAEYVSGACGIDSRRVVQILYPIDTTVFAPDDRPREPLVLFVGRVERRKGARLLLQAVSEVRRRQPRSRFAFVGRICEDMESEAGVLPEGVKFFGPVKRQDLVEWYRRASLLCQPSEWDNSPNTIYEAMSCGCPVVATRVGGIPELVDDGTTGFLVRRDDPGELARAIASILEDPARVARMGALARNKAVSSFDIRKIADETLAFYSSVLRESRSTSRP